MTIIVAKTYNAITQIRRRSARTSGVVDKNGAFGTIRSRLTTIGLLVVFLTALSSPQASASVVSLSGGFTGYNGLAGCGQFTTIVNGQDVTPTLTCNPNTDTSPLALSFAPVSSVEFYARQLGTDLTHNLVGFTPAGPQDGFGVGSIFHLGTLTFTNGIWFGTGAAATFSFELTASSADPAFNGKVLDGSLTLFITPNDFTTPRTPAQNADFVYFTGFPNIGSVRVYELNDSPTHTNSGTVEVYGVIDDIIPTSLANAQGGAFIDPGIDAEPSSQLPEPGGITLAGLGFAALVLTRLARVRHHGFWSKHIGGEWRPLTDQAGPSILVGTTIALLSFSGSADAATIDPTIIQANTGLAAGVGGCASENNCKGDNMLFAGTFYQPAGLFDKAIALGQATSDKGGYVSGFAEAEFGRLRAYALAAAGDYPPTDTTDAQATAYFYEPIEFISSDPLVKNATFLFSYGLDGTVTPGGSSVLNFGYGDLSVLIGYTHTGDIFNDDVRSKYDSTEVNFHTSLSLTVQTNQVVYIYEKLIAKTIDFTESGFGSTNADFSETATLSLDVITPGVSIITGSGYDYSTPADVPECSTCLLLSVGLGGLLAARWAEGAKRSPTN